MGTTINGIYVKEMHDGYTEEVGERGATGRKAYLVPNWADRFAVVNGMLGLAEVSGGPGGAITLGSPLLHPESTGMVALSISVEGFGNPRQGPNQMEFDSAIVAVQFGVPPYQPLTEDDPEGLHSFSPDQRYVFATQELDFGGEYLTMKGRKLKFEDSQHIFRDQSYQMPIDHTHMTLTLHKVPYMPWAKRRAIGKDTINNATFWGCPARTLKFNGAKTRRTMTAGVGGPQTVQEVTYSFTYRAYEWDTTYNNRSGLWERVLFEADSSPVIPSGDFNTIIPVEYLIA